MSLKSLLPNFQKAILPIEKLRDYCLSNSHPQGKHKAAQFKLKLGLSANDAEWLQAQILTAIATNKAQEKNYDEYGKRFQVDFDITHNQLSVSIRTAWIIRQGEDAPRLTSCYIKL